jgi:hypothetical protein
MTDAEGASTVVEIANSLKKLQPSIICLQEVDLRKRPDALEEVASAIGGGMQIAFYGHVKVRER